MWGIILACFAAMENYSGAIAIRIFLGILQTSIPTALVLVTSQVGRIGPRQILHLTEPVVHEA